MKSIRTAFWLAAALAAGVTSLPASAQQTFTMKMSTPTINDATHEWMKQFKAGVESRANGRMKVEIYPANQLGAIPRTVEGVALGTIELTFVSAGYFAPYDPRFEVLEMPGLFDNLAQANKVYLDPEVRGRIANYGKDKGIEPLLCVANGPMAVASNRPLKKVEDFNGMKIRTPGTTPLQVNPLKKLGASPVALPIGEALPAMQNKTIDAVAAAYTVFIGFKYFDVTKNVTVLPKTYLMACGVTSKKFLRTIGPDLEKIVREEALKAQNSFAAVSQEEVDVGRKTWEKNGGQVHEFGADDAKRYLDTVSEVAGGLLNTPALKEDAAAFVEASKRAK
ncbi:TRAP-type C4-dicarboxylate transport system, substrate-binding protein [Noviherbaspirillum humi]|uniref:TRAP-type C4-dicarboxylate transport system, substrate-binding protein n=1 Tax=Noviherbaspirillum humi TaxID=1688639 RepID=A0A239LCZ9_9BURK|nr:TRAP transporter substrate-binding protein [Noviherbaspirillum humi]SNT27404.1 TRAP-type C4-dicarboxylate transport system, substrate-binding protein [Noviherbaspirillum humi]